jgi:RimJ/RimL family protein N-acetyltransferase
VRAPPELITAALVTLRRAGPSDSSALYQVARDPEVMRFMDWPMPTDPKSTEAHLERAVVSWESGSEYQWVILERASAECVGTISCRPKGNSADFGYFLDRRYWGRSYAREAASAVLDWLNTQSEIARIWATVDTENARSRRLLERLGLRLECVLFRATVRPNIGLAPRDTAVYARTKAPLTCVGASRDA